MEALDEMLRQGGDRAVRQASRFLMGTDSVHQSLQAVAKRLDDLSVPYAVAGGMALVGHGYMRTTEDVDILVTPEGLETIHANLTGLGYVALFDGSRNLRDTNTGVRIEFIVTGQYPGDGKPKPIAFPDPADVATEIDGISYIRLPSLVELKLASGMTNPGRLRDLADVQELIRVLTLPEEYADTLDPYVRGKFAELRSGVRHNMGEQT